MYRILSVTLLLSACADASPLGEWAGTCTVSGEDIWFSWYNINDDRPGALNDPEASGEVLIYQASGEVDLLPDLYASVQLIHCIDPNGCDYGAADDLRDKPDRHTRIDFSSSGGRVLILEANDIEKKAIEGTCWTPGLGWGSFEATRELSQFFDDYYDQRHND